MLPWKEPITQEFLAVEIVLEIVLFVQDFLVFWSALERVNSMADQWCCLTLDTQKAKATLLQYKCVIPGKEGLLQGDEKTFSGQRCEKLIQQRLKEIRQMLHETDQLSSLTYPQRTNTN